ncbi:MAG: phenylalanine--tRNA ligase subunit beta [Candidatus Micrarchaeia archaeon]
MTILEMSKKRLKDLIGKNLSIDELEDILFDIGMELDKYDNEMLYIDITPDRPDMLSDEGFARALKNYLGIDKFKEYKFEKSDIEIFVDKKVEAVRPYIAAFIAKNLKMSKERLDDIIETQEKLHGTFCRNRRSAAIGIYPLEKITPPIYYTAETPDKISFKPLNADVVMTGFEILEKHEKGIKYGHLLKNAKEFPILIDSKKNILSMPPIINSGLIGKVDEDTKDIIVEVTGITESRVEQLINILSSMFADMGAKIYTVKVNYGKISKFYPSTKQNIMELSNDYVKKVIGLNIELKELEKLLTRMGYKVTKLNKVENKIEIIIPYYRADILHEIDVVDDIARAYKLSNMEPEIPSVSTFGNTLKKTKMSEFIRSLLIGMGFTEALTLALTNTKYQYDDMNIKPSDNIEIPDAKAKEINTMRTWIMPELLRALKANESFGIPIKLFEINDVCARDDRTETGYKNITKLSVIITDQQATFTDIKQILNMLMNILNVEYDVDEENHSSFIEGRCGRINIKDKANNEYKNIGIIGEVSPKVLENFAWRYPIAAFEINIESFSNLI